jgi:hypothetical protein
MRNQQAIQEALVAEAGARAEAAAIVQEANSRSASPKLELESVTSEEKITNFLRTSDPEECSIEDCIDPMIINPRAFDSICPKQNMITTHPKVTTTTTLANNVYVPPPKLSFRADPYVVVSPPRASHTFAQTFYNVETRTTPANEANMTTSMVNHVPKSAIPNAYVFPPQPNVVMHFIPVTPNLVSSQVLISVPYNSFVPLSLCKIREVVPEPQLPSSSVGAVAPVHQNQIGPIGNPSQGVLLANPSLRIARPDSVPNTTDQRLSWFHLGLFPRHLLPILVSHRNLAPGIRCLPHQMLSRTQWEPNPRHLL